MKEINKEELIDILEDCGVDIDSNGIKTSNIDQFLTADLDATQDELDPLYDIICQEIQNRRPDLSCSKDGAFINIHLDEKLLVKFEVEDIDIDGQEVTMKVGSPFGEEIIHIEDSGAIEIDDLVERIEQAEEESGVRW